MIQSIEDFIRFIPTARGTNYEDIAPFVQEGLLWSKTEIFGEQLISAIYAGINNEAIRLLDSIVALKAYAGAIPFLDVVQTSNGFAVVNNANHAPASRDRVQRLLTFVNERLFEHTDMLIEYVTNMPELMRHWRAHFRFEYLTELVYHVEIHKDFWDDLCEAEGITDKKKKLERCNEEKENIKKFLTGIENSGKLWISGFYTNPTGEEIRYVKITKVDEGKEGGDWIEDSEEASNMLCYADNVHPSMVGAAPGKSKGSFSGSVQRELFTMKQSLEKAYQDILLEPLFVIKKYNGWENFKYDVPVITLTTLDKGKDAEEYTLRDNENE